VLELGGVRDVLTKSIGTQNPINLVKATMAGLTSLRRPEEVAELRGLSVKEVLGLHLEPKSAGQGNGAATVDDPPPAADESEQSSDHRSQELPGSTRAEGDSSPSEGASISDSSPPSEGSPVEGGSEGSPAEGGIDSAAAEGGSESTQPEDDSEQPEPDSEKADDS
jgi:hypothetical protein